MPIRLLNIGNAKSCVATKFILNQPLHYETNKRGGEGGGRRYGAAARLYYFHKSYVRCNQQVYENNLKIYRICI